MNEDRNEKEQAMYAVRNSCGGYLMPGSGRRRSFTLLEFLAQTFSDQASAQREIKAIGSRILVIKGGIKADYGPLTIIQITDK